MFILTACVLPTAAETKRLPQLTPAPLSIRLLALSDLQQGHSLVIYTEDVN